MIALVLGGNSSLDQARIDRIGTLIYINKHWLRTTKADRLCGCHECARNRNNLMAQSDATGQQREPERLRAASDSYAVRVTTETGEFLLEFFHKRAARKGATLNYLRDNSGELVEKRLVVRS